jgi:hypothetical protein
MRPPVSVGGGAGSGASASDKATKRRREHGNRSKAAIAAFRETREVRRLIRDLIIQSERK